MLKHVVYDVLKNSQLISNDIKAIQVSPDHKKSQADTFD